MGILYSSHSLNKYFPGHSSVWECICEKDKTGSLPSWSPWSCRGDRLEKKQSKYGVNKFLHRALHSSTIHNSPKVEITQMFIDRWMGKQNVIYTHHGILLRLKKEWLSDTYYIPWMHLENIVLTERTQTQKITYCTIPFIWNRHKKQIGGCQVLRGKGKWGEIAQWLLGFLLGWWKCFGTR